MKLTVCLLLVLVTGSFAYPVSQPTYPNTPYISAQAIPAVQYRQPAQPYLQPQFISAAIQGTQITRPVYEGDKGAGLQKYSTQIKQPIQQVLLSGNVDRQIQKVAQAAGPLYLHQIQAAQQQGQAQQALAAAQRKATSQTLNRQIQPIPIPQPQPQYLREVPQQTQVKYARPAAAVAQAYRPVASPAQEARDQQNPEEYD
ncbi:hypothetical protein BDFB_005999, partial [Asbolus verrucosus]